MCVYNKLYIDYIGDFVQKMINDLNRGVKVINAVARYSEAAILIKNLLADEDLFVGEVEISKPENNGYYREYLVTVTDDYEISCSPLYVESYERYLDYDSEITYIFENCSRKAVEKCRVNDVTVVCYGFLDKEYDEPENTLNAKATAKTENKDTEKSKDSNSYKNLKIVVHSDEWEENIKKIVKDFERMSKLYRDALLYNDLSFRLP